MGRRGASLYLCAGLQSSGSTLISWCFLQRRDMDGILDADNDLLPQIDPAIGRPLVWYKTTLSCFRLSELVDYYRDEGWEVRPLLVIRDLRRVWASLLTKPYARNGLTAEDPPLRLRIRRFVEDWQTALRRGWATIRYESLVEEPQRTLENVCRHLELPWDDSMLRWPKRTEDIADAQWGNETFRSTCGQGLIETLARGRKRSQSPTIPPGDLDWLQREFRQFNIENGYPLVLRSAEMLATSIADSTPTFRATRRYDWETKRKPVRWLLSRLGVPYQKLIDRRTWKRAA